MHKTIAITLLIFAAGCSSSSTNSDAATGAGGTSGGGGSGGQNANSDGAADGAATFTLKMENYLSWCSVTEQGTNESSTALVTMTFPAGTVVDLSAMALNSTFVWGYWVGTDGDTSTTTHDTNMSTTVTMTKDKTVQACCPFAPATGSLATACPGPT